MDIVWAAQLSRDIGMDESYAEAADDYIVRHNWWYDGTVHFGNLADRNDHSLCTHG